MIWITTLCVLLVVAWLIFNGLNERRWVKAHGEEDNASDEDLLYRLSSGSRRNAEVRGEEDTFFGRIVARNKEREENFDKRLKDRLHAEQAAKDDNGGPQNLFERATSKVAEKSARLEERTVELSKRVAASGEGVMTSVTGKVASGMDKGRASVRRQAEEETGDLMTRISGRINKKVEGMKND